MRHGRVDWTIEVCSVWELTDHDECVTLERPEGALQFSSMTKTKGVFDLTEVEGVAARSGSDGWGAFEEVRWGEFFGVAYRYSEGNTQWCRWFLAKGATFVFATYISEVEISSEVSKDISRVLSSLRLESGLSNNLINRTTKALRALVAGHR